MSEGLAVASSLGAPAQFIPGYGRATAIDNGVAVGSDTGIGVTFQPNATNPALADTCVVLNSTLTNNIPANSWFLNEATDINSQGLS
jgi:hypothetical protein